MCPRNTLDVKAEVNSGSVNMFLISGILDTGRVEIEAVDAALVAEQAGLDTFVDHLVLMHGADRMWKGSTNYAAVVVGAGEEMRSGIKAAAELAGVKVAFVDQDRFSKGGVVAAVSAEGIIGADDLLGSDIKVRGVLRDPASPLYESFVNELDSVIIADASFRAITLVYLKHIVRNQRYVSSFTKAGINKLKDMQAKGSLSANASGNGVVAEEVRKDSDEIDESLFANLKSDVAF